MVLGLALVVLGVSGLVPDISVPPGSGPILVAVGFVAMVIGLSAAEWLLPAPKRPGERA